MVRLVVPFGHVPEKPFGHVHAKQGIEGVRRTEGGLLSAGRYKPSKNHQNKHRQSHFSQSLFANSPRKVYLRPEKSPRKV